jgi:hypothetical protein
VGLEREDSDGAPGGLEVDEPEGSFAGIVFWHSLEHLNPAGGALDRAASLLAPSGVLIIAMPNPASLQAAVFGDSWFGLDLPRHLVHVPAAALLTRLRRLGLAIEHVGYLRGGQNLFGWLYGWVRLLPGRPDLYQAIRRRQARREPQPASSRVLAITAAAVLLPFAAVCVAVETATRRGGSIYVEARRV